MKVLSLGLEVDHETLDIDHFSSSRSFLDYDIVIWNPNEVLYEYQSDTLNSTYRGLKNLSDNDSAKVQGDIERRQKEMSEMLNLGRSIVVFTPAPQVCSVDTGKREYSGTGKNARTTRLVTTVDLLSSLPVKDLKTVKALGTSIEFKGQEPFASFWRANKEYLSYRAYFQEPLGEPLFFIRKTKQAVGSYMRVGNGILLFIPSFLDEEHEIGFNVSEAEAEKAGERFVDSLIILIKELQKYTGDFELPAWTNSYVLPQEPEQRKELRNLNNDLNSLLARISEQKEAIAQLERHKVLFAGSGPALEIQTKKLFEELGFTVTEAEPGRDDLVLEYEGKVAVVEIKGVSKSAAERHAAQLEKWVSEYYSSHEINPKGILVVNAFSSVPLEDRGKAAFPDQMLGYSKRRGHCLITGSQLLGLYLDCNGNPVKKDEVIDRIFATEGVFEGYQNWSSFLTKANENLSTEEEAKK